MNAVKRREYILKELEKSETPISAGSFAEKLGISRQIIVGDVALLRASGSRIESTPRGYIIRNVSKTKPRTARLVCMHNQEQTEQELNICVDNGCRVVDVIVDHPIYGQLTGILDISTRYDVKCFMKKLADEEAHSLSELTDGVHIHTIEYHDDEALRRVRDELRSAGILFE